MPTIDFNKAVQDARGASFEALPIGDYDVEVAKTEAVTSSNGKPMVKTTFKVISGPYEKRPIINQFVLSLENPQATAIFFRHMKAFGLTEEWFASLGQVQSLEPVASALLGRRARLSIGHREWQGETRNEVKGVKPYTGAPPMPGPAGPTGPGGGGFPIPGPGTGPTPPQSAVVVPAGPIAPPPPVPMPVAPPAPAAVADAPPLPTAAPQVQSMPQPPAQAVPASVPTPATAPAESAGSPGAASTPSESIAPTSEPQAPSAPPALPF